MSFFNRLLRRRSTGSDHKDLFANAVVKSLRDAGEQRSIKYDPDGFFVDIGDGSELRRTNLSNFFAEYQRARNDDARQAVLGQIGRMHSLHNEVLPATFADIAPNLRPAVTSRAAWAFQELRARAQHVRLDDFYACPLANHLIVNVAYDRPDAIMRLSRPHFDGWQVSAAQAMKVSIENLRRSTDGWFREVHPGVYISPWSDSYDASRLLMTDEIRRLGVRGEPVAIVPNRICTLVSGSEDIRGLATMLEIATEACEVDRPISLCPLRLSGETWSTFAPDVAHRQCDALLGYRHARLREQMTLYGTQQELLNQCESDWFVASLSGFAAGDIVLGTVAVWSEGVDALLPEAESIAFMGADLHSAQAPWAKVREVMGEQMEQTEYWPPRYAVRCFPTEQQFAAMGVDRDEKRGAGQDALGQVAESILETAGRRSPKPPSEGPN